MLSIFSPPRKMGRGGWFVMAFPPFLNWLNIGWFQLNLSLAFIFESFNRILKHMESF